MTITARHAAGVVLTLVILFCGRYVSADALSGQPPECLPVIDFEGDDVVAAPAGGPADRAHVFRIEPDPAASEHRGPVIKPVQGNWAAHKRLQVWVYVRGTGEHWNGRLRCYYHGPKFVDLTLFVPGKEFEGWREFSFDLDEHFANIDRSKIHRLWVYSYDKWYTRKADLEVFVGSIRLCVPNDIPDWRWDGEKLVSGFDDVSYATPPQRLVWLEGEDCTDHNWVEGPSWNCWAFGWSGIHGGVLDLATWKLPGDDGYYARYSFSVPREGSYTAYYLGRDVNYQASPITWEIDDGDARSPGKTLERVRNIKYCLSRLGEFDAGAGDHTITIRVREPWGGDYLPFYSQQIDAILISRTTREVYGEQPPVDTSKPGSAMAGEDRWVWDRASGDTDGPAGTGAVHDDASASLKRIVAGDLSVDFSSVTGGIRGVSFGGDSGRWQAATTNVAPPLLAATDLADVYNELSGVVRWSQQGDSHVVVLSGEHISAVAHITPDADANELRIDITVTNNGPDNIWRVEYGHMTGITLGDKAEDDTYLLGQIEYGNGRHRRISPQLAFDSYIAYDGKHTLYARIEDQGLLDTQAYCGRDDEHDKPGFIAWTKFPRIKPGESFTMPTVVIGADDSGHWHGAADRFSSWWHSWAKTPYIPEWLKSVGGVFVGYNVTGEDPVTECVNQLEEVRSQTGIIWGHSGYWLPYMTEGWYPLNYRLTTEQINTQREVISAIHDHGGRISYYSNALMFSRVVPSFDLYGRKFATVARNGGIWFSEHTNRHHPMALPYPNRLWAEEYVRAIESAAVLTGLDLLYIDQLGAVPAHLDFDPDGHAHEHYGQWVAGSVQFVKTVHERLRPERPELATMIECPLPAAQQYLSLGLLSYYRSDVLRYVFPHYYNVTGSYGKVDPEKLCAQARESFVLGQPLLVYRRHEEVNDYIRGIVTLKQQVDRLLYEGRYCDTVGVSVDDEHLHAVVYTKWDGSGLLVAAVRDGVTAGLNGDTSRGSVPVQAYTTTPRPEPAVRDESAPGASVTIDIGRLGVYGVSQGRVVSDVDTQWRQWPVRQRGDSMTLPIPEGNAVLVDLSR